MTTPHTTPNSYINPGLAFAELGRILYTDQSRNEILQRVAELAKETIPQLADVSITLIKDCQPQTVVFTGSLAINLDERQYASGFGPCTDAAVSGNTVIVDTRRPSDGYPDFAALAAARSINHVLSVGLPLPQRVIGALNMYSDADQPFAASSITLAHTFAGYAAVALANAISYHDIVKLVTDMQTAMTSRSVIEQAKGIIVAREHCTTEEAFTRLSTLSQRSNTKLRDLAAQLVSSAATEGRSDPQPQPVHRRHLSI